MLADDFGTPFAAGRPQRIVSLVPSLTEALFAWGAAPRIVGVTQFCAEPAAQVAPLPKIGGTKTPNLPAIIALQPDFVVASAEENRREDVAALRAAGLTVFVTHYPTVAAALAGLRILATVVGVEPVDWGWLCDAEAAVAGLAGREQQPVRYFCPIWRRPYMVARRDTYMSDLLALAGGENAFADAAPLHYYTVELDRLPSAQPEIILLPDEPYHFRPRHLSDFDPYAASAAPAQRPVHFIDGKALTWYGPRTAAALRDFATLFAGARSPHASGLAARAGG